MMNMGFFSQAASGPTVSASNADCWRSSDSGDAFANMEYRSDGTEFMTNTFPARPATPSVSRGTWLTSGNASDVWVQRTIDSGQALDTDAGSGRLNLGTTRRFGNTVITVGSDNSLVTFRFYDAASGGNLLFTTSSLIVRAVGFDE